MTALQLPGLEGPPTSVRVRLLPWKPRWRAGRVPEGWDFDYDSFGDDPISMLIGLVALILFLPIVLVVLVGVAVLALEALILALLLPLTFLARLVGLQSWWLIVRDASGHRAALEVRGTRHMLARRAQLREEINA